MLINTQAACRENCDINAAKKGVATYIFGIALVLMFYFSLKWAMLG
tara:strand:- start:479 stop:616 length:138 start_codon:yes stop_codon:yes gene_type:complete